MHRSINYFALDESDVSFEVGDRGVCTGAKALQTLYANQYGSAPLEGNLLVQYVTTGSIQIAGDGKTAKGMWRCLHVEAIAQGQGKGEPVPMWACGVYAVDFIKKGTQWKIWHLHWFRNVKVWDKTWAFAGALLNLHDLGTTIYHNPYTVEGVQDSIPPCPLPYEHYDGQEWMITDQSKLWEG
ncbi:hypothetical protein LTR10_013236 [Elasticomyces elasticus]|uniref:SnoaL-like domain-containing protein n=1 Tax=Exophiala sideris TaxID=1016849 RepID=A0ABR0JBW8_9EURO|nr:hypothetical protein LTR10_013236 [Elasticomyces elasticus]KAK5030615.1 hypothetical protein LTS07_005399 [Exophiala sideris]KAK5038669.1 hypothetical protein LTR13_004416 [Exophiala sideris]KAK5060550.1 hypothetical protein LTR69_005867 [Exophiala sideris]KAK5183462.1 hypothetical protein LTR44_004463 [Eurotiomycetes sp. CCFEE 6388]